MCVLWFEIRGIVSVIGQGSTFLVILFIWCCFWTDVVGRLFEVEGGQLLYQLCRGLFVTLNP